ncbi:hypothetical protein RIF29_29835 [Crotalaria pallida]|uniref:Uncharacterized protein n=1 Tax=Crotalaria pallida TaxID=3830 RepID=A0AAN9EFI1_CROPI
MIYHQGKLIPVVDLTAAGEESESTATAETGLGLIGLPKGSILILLKDSHSDRLLQTNPPCSSWPPIREPTLDPAAPKPSKQTCSGRRHDEQIQHPHHSHCTLDLKEDLRTKESSKLKNFQEQKILLPLPPNDAEIGARYYTHS